MHSSLRIVAAVIYLAGFMPYIVATLQRKTRPTKISWILWASLDFIIFIGMYHKGVLSEQLIGVVTGETIVAILALRYGKSEWTKLDKFCLVGGIIGITLWQTFDNPTLAILASLATAFFAAATPTLVKCWHDPSSENHTAWTMFWISSTLATLSVPEWSIEHAAQPITFVTFQTIMMYLLWVRPWWTKKRETT